MALVNQNTRVREVSYAKRSNYCFKQFNIDHGISTINYRRNMLKKLSELQKTSKGAYELVEKLRAMVFIAKSPEDIEKIRILLNQDKTGDAYKYFLTWRENIFFLINRYKSREEIRKIIVAGLTLEVIIWCCLRYQKVITSAEIKDMFGN